jgi:hypothetical protein
MSSLPPQSSQLNWLAHHTFRTCQVLQHLTGVCRVTNVIFVRSPALGKVHQLAAIQAGCCRSRCACASSFISGPSREHSGEKAHDKLLL